MDSIIYKLYEGQITPMESSEFKPTRFQKRRDRFLKNTSPGWIGWKQQNRRRTKS